VLALAIESDMVDGWYFSGFLKSSELKRAVRKRRPQSGGGRKGLSVRTRGLGGSSDANFRTFCAKKLRIFRNMWCVRTDKREGV